MSTRIRTLTRSTTVARRPERHGLSASAPVTAKDVTDWLERRARELDYEEERTILAIVAAATDHMPALMADQDLVVESASATREILRLVIGTVLPADGPVGGGSPATAFVSIVGLWVRRGVELRLLLKGLRTAQAAFWRYWMTDVTARIEDPDLRAAVLDHSWEQISHWNEFQLEHLEEIYGEERDRWLKGAQARRAEQIRSLLAGETTSEEEAAVALGYDLRVVHTALVLWSDEAEPYADALPGLEEAARGAAVALGGGRALTIPAGSRALWAWVGTYGSPDPGAWQAMKRLELTDGIRIAAGRPASGLTGFRTSHQDAQLVRRLAPAADSLDRLVRYDDVELACLMLRETEGMRRLVRHELGELTASDPSSARLRETARVYLACGGNAREAAERLNVHKNTVHYRLARIEEQLGRSIASRRLELEVALMLAHTLGDHVLGDSS